MDTARAQSTLPGENPGVMPNLESFAEEGTTFSQAITTAPWTLPSHASMFTGQYTSDHGTHAGSTQFSPEVDPLAALLQSHGYRTIGVSNNSWIAPEFGFDTGFEEFYRGWEVVTGGADLSKVSQGGDSLFEQFRSLLSSVSFSELPQTLVNAAYARFLYRRSDYGARATNFRLKRLLGGNNDRPFFAFVNYLEPHLEYDPPEPYRYGHLPDYISENNAESTPQRPWEYLGGVVEMDSQDFEALRALYHAELSYLDYRLGRLFDYLTEENILDETLVVVVGDHGENIGDHGMMDHQYGLYDTLLRVPLFVRHPDTVAAGRISDSLVELRSIYPTILGHANVPLPEDNTVAKESLLAEDGIDQSSAGDQKEVFAEYLTPQPAIERLQELANDTADVRQFNRSLRCIRTDNWKYVAGSDGSDWLYDLSADPEEEVDVADQYPNRTAEFRNRLIETFGSFVTPDENMKDKIDDSTSKRLEDLGYI